MGATIASLQRAQTNRLYVTGLDAVDGTPVIDIKPVMREFLTRGDLRQPEWATELMKSYW